MDLIWHPEIHRISHPITISYTVPNSSSAYLFHDRLDDYVLQIRSVPWLLLLLFLLPHTAGDRMHCIDLLDTFRRDILPNTIHYSHM